MKLATRLAIVCGCALLAVIFLANTLYTVQLRQITDLFEQRSQARNDQVAALDTQRDLKALLVAHDRLLFFSNDPARRAELTAEIDQLDKTVDTELRAGAETDDNDAIRSLYQQALATWVTFRSNYRSDLQKAQNAEQAAASGREHADQVALLETQLGQIEQDAVKAVESANTRAGQAVSFARSLLWILASAIVLVLGILLYFTSRNIHRTVTSAAEQNEKKARRSKEIQANLMTEVQAAPDLASAGSIIVSRTAQALDAKHGGALYLRQTQETDQFALVASYAFHRRKDLPTSFGIGDGLVGQCALEGNRIEVTGAPGGDYVEIVSGLGKTEPCP